MEIEKGQLPNGNSYIAFPDGNDELCKIESQGKGLYFYLDNEEYAPFLIQEQIKALLPYLQSFAETGTLEPQENTLQGGRGALSILAEHRARYSQQFAHEKERIQESLNYGIYNPDASQSASQLELKLEALKDLEDDLVRAQSTLQGGDERVDMIVKASAKRVLEVIEVQKERIQALEKLVKEWRVTVFTSSSLALNDLQKRTNQLLGE